jgi:hypothetical protein
VRTASLLLFVRVVLLEEFAAGDQEFLVREGLVFGFGSPTT